VSLTPRTKSSSVPVVLCRRPESDAMLHVFRVLELGSGYVIATTVDISQGESCTTHPHSWKAHLFGTDKIRGILGDARCMWRPP
jgi:hypothetical protein